MPAWRVGLRYDRLNIGDVNAASNSANLFVPDHSPTRATLMVDWSLSEFSRLRLQFANDRARYGVTDNQFVVQYQMSLGTHGAHGY
jgi:phosphate-selective porin